MKLQVCFFQSIKYQPHVIPPANSISWTLLELSRHPEMQNRLREEIFAKKRELAAKGDTTGNFVAEDFDTLPYLNAVLKVSSELPECPDRHDMDLQLLLPLGITSLSFRRTTDSTNGQCRRRDPS